ncbi:ATP-binding protein [Tateyamaria omphalii]|uniref:histidine kinase n=1 Tax=Tateyamaria omphalii TaxID=299262 RepID=A0A1P8MXU0_9RHOB|nr:ATP-binding protein [Tateyamaria omphalii]APX12907.1 hypothetical protein BWR18_15355 [Tateyamaria omphalii]
MPDGIAGRFALLLIISLICANFLALAVLSYERNRLERATLVAREEERIVSLVPALEAASPSIRPRMAELTSTRSSAVTVERAPLIMVQSDAPRSRALADALTETLGGRDVKAAIHRRPDDDRSDRRESVAASILLETPGGEPKQWLNIQSKGPRPLPPLIEEGAFLLILGASLTAVLGVGLVFVRRLTQPLTALAKAARAAGQGDRAARVSTEGPREMRDAATAFNDMQARIAQFEAERMRTLAAVGHDLRTPLTSLRIRAEMLGTDESASMIRTLEEMTVMADGLVAYARGARENEDVTYIDLVTLLEQASGDRQGWFEATEAIEVSGRPVALGRAFGNLIDNAIRYGGSAKVTAERIGETALVTIEDNGPGIPDEKLSKVFEPFVRGDDSRSADTGGVGLGLAISRDIVVAHGGTLTLSNRPGGGLRAAVRLPVTTVAVAG